MRFEQFRKMLGILKPAGVRTIDIMGGEPTLHPDIETMIADAEEAGFLVNISSNGTDLSMLERIIRKNKRTTVGISVNERLELERVKGFIEQHHPVVKTVFRKGLDLSMADELLALRPKRFFLPGRHA
jgi:MoaA/NifB/PqqE/SkfB family radical SAM enzyme